MINKIFRDYERTYSPKEIYLGKLEKSCYDYEIMRKRLVDRYNFLYNNVQYPTNFLKE